VTISNDRPESMNFWRIVRPMPAIAEYNFVLSARNIAVLS